MILDIAIKSEILEICELNEESKLNLHMKIIWIKSFSLFLGEIEAVDLSLNKIKIDGKWINLDLSEISSSIIILFHL